MRGFATGVAGVLAVCGVAAGQSPSLYGVNFAGNLYSINTTSGAATLVGATGFTRYNAAAGGTDGMIYAFRFRDVNLTGDTHKVVKINPATGVGTMLFDFGTTNDLRGMAFGPAGRLYAIREGSIDELVTIDLATGSVLLVGPTGRSDLQGLAYTAGGEMFAVGVAAPGGLYRLDVGTGAATLIGPLTGAASGEPQSLEYASGTTAWMARTSFMTVDLTTGAVTVAGPLGAPDFRGLAVIGGGPAPCYANCDGSTTPPILNVNDFICFQSAYAAGASYANCDNSTTPPVLNVNDFICFQSAYAAGCP